jgi:hypothetical protein
MINIQVGMYFGVPGKLEESDYDLYHERKEVKKCVILNLCTIAFYYRLLWYSCPFPSLLAN